MSKESYVRGFCKAAEAAGVNPQALIKLAGPISDAVGMTVGNMIPVVGPTANLIGSHAGLVSDDFKENGGHGALSFIPGVGGYRFAKRISSQLKHEQEEARKEGRKDVSPVAHHMAESLGPFTSLLSSTALGALAGGVLKGKSGAGKGALLGATAAGAATLIGALAAAIKRRRTAKEQMDSDAESVLMKYLVPGTASYNAWKRYGRSQGDRDENPENKKSEKKAAAPAVSDIWEKVKSYLDKARDWYGEQGEGTKSLIGTGVGALGIGALNKLLGGKFSNGAILGGIGGLAASGIDWSKIFNKAKPAENTIAKT